jgi:hypothetical protein
MADAAAGSLLRLVALPVAVRLTAVMLVAVTGTVTWAWNSRWAELDSTVPSVQDDVPLPLPQPKLKTGVPVPAVDCSWMLADDTVPPSAQAPTSQVAACPRSALCCRGMTPTHKLAGVVAAASNAVSTAVWRDVPSATAVLVDVPVAVGAELVGADVVGADEVGAELVGAELVGADVLGAGVVGAGVVGSGVVGNGVVGSGVVGAGVVGAGVVGAEVAGAGVVAVDVVGVAVDLAVELADALGDALADFSGSQDSAIPDVVAAVALLFSAITAPPEAAVNSALPAIKVTARRRPCAIRILIHIDRHHVKSIICCEVIESEFQPGLEPYAPVGTQNLLLYERTVNAEQIDAVQGSS